jgi:heterodisulfide reductase subunit A
MAHQRAEDVQCTHVFSDWCLAGKGHQEFKDRLQGERTEMVRVARPGDVQVTRAGDGFIVRCGDREISVDMVVLAPAMVPAEGTGGLAALLGVPLDRNGFYAAEHERIKPTSTNIRGIYVAGCATGPKDIAQTVMQARAAAGSALHDIVPGEKLELEPAVAHVDEALCAGCGVCVPLCPYQAIGRNGSKTAQVNGVLCRGCGTCVAACPSGALENHHFTTDQVFAEIEGVLR